MLFRSDLFSPLLSPQVGALVATHDATPRSMLDNASPNSQAPSTDAPRVDPPIDTPSPSLRPHELSLRIEGPNDQNVNVRVFGSASHMRVNVQSSDPIVRSTLQGHLGDLVSSLHSKGFQAEVHPPSALRGFESSAVEKVGTIVESAGSGESTHNGFNFGDSQEATDRNNYYGAQNFQGRQRRNPQDPRPQQTARRKQHGNS